MCAALAKRRVDYTIIRWIRATLDGRLATVTFGGLVSLCLGAAHGEVSCHLSSGVLLLVNC